MHLHETETPIMLEGAIEPVGYRVKTKDFDFSAIYETDGTVNTYVEWGDDQGGDMANHHSMAEAKRYLEALVRASEPKEEPVVKVDLTKYVIESMEAGMQKVGMADTPKNRIEVLGGMHKKLVDEEPSTHSIRPILLVIEDEVIRLSEELG